MNWRFWKKPEPAKMVSLPQEVYDAIWQEGRQYGFAEGQLAGRHKLLDEIQNELERNGKLPADFTTADLGRHRVRSLH